MRFLFYSHDGMGLGHTRRHIAIARALVGMAPDCSILIATGADEVNRLGLPEEVEILKLPGLRKLANDQYSSRRLRISTEEIRSLRSELLLTTVKSFRPSVVLVDKHPFGAKGEFRAGLQAARSIGASTVLGFRDILDESATVRQEWEPYEMVKRIEDNFDQLLIYGDRVIFDPISEYNFSAAVAARTFFCGYVVNPAREHVVDSRLAAVLQNRSKPIVVATPGGGEDGFLLLEQFLAASTNAKWQGVVVAGPMIPEAKLEILQNLSAAAQVPLFTFVSNLSGLFPSLDALVCMGGYNTLAESVSCGVPTICVPRVFPRTEQLIRAKAFERLGLVRTIHPENLSPEKLDEEIQLALTRPTTVIKPGTLLNFNGAEQAAQTLLNLADAQSKIVRLAS